MEFQFTGKELKGVEEELKRGQGSHEIKTPEGQWAEYDKLIDDFLNDPDAIIIRQHKRTRRGKSKMGRSGFVSSFKASYKTRGKNTPWSKLKSAVDKFEQHKNNNKLRRSITSIIKKFNKDNKNLVIVQDIDEVQTRKTTPKKQPTKSRQKQMIEVGKRALKQVKKDTESIKLLQDTGFIVKVGKKKKEEERKRQEPQPQTEAQEMQKLEAELQREEMLTEFTKRHITNAALKRLAEQRKFLESGLDPEKEEEILNRFNVLSSQLDLSSERGKNILEEAKKQSEEREQILANLERRVSAEREAANRGLVVSNVNIRPLIRQRELLDKVIRRMVQASRRSVQRRMRTRGRPKTINMRRAITVLAQGQTTETLLHPDQFHGMDRLGPLGSANYTSMPSSGQNLIDVSRPPLESPINVPTIDLSDIDLSGLDLTEPEAEFSSTDLGDITGSEAEFSSRSQDQSITEPEAEFSSRSQDQRPIFHQPIWTLTESETSFMGSETSFTSFGTGSETSFMGSETSFTSFGTGSETEISDLDNIPEITFQDVDDQRLAAIGNQMDLREGAAEIVQDSVENQFIRHDIHTFSEDSDYENDGWQAMRNQQGDRNQPRIPPFAPFMARFESMLEDVVQARRPPVQQGHHGLPPTSQTRGVSHRSANPRQLFDAIDLNRDGKISINELRHARGTPALADIMATHPSLLMGHQQAMRIQKRDIQLPTSQGFMDNVNLVQQSVGQYRAHRDIFNVRF